MNWENIIKKQEVYELLSKRRKRGFTPETTPYGLGLFSSKEKIKQYILNNNKYEGDNSMQLDELLRINNLTILPRYVQ